MVSTRRHAFPFPALFALGVGVTLAAAILAAGCARESVGEAMRSEPDEAYENPAALGDWEFARLRDPATNNIPPGIRRAELAYAASLPSRSAGLYKSAGVADYGWSGRGPYNIGGRTRALALDIDDENIILAGGVSGGMWRSTDAGGTWTRATLRTQMPAVSCIAQDPRPGKHAVWYYGSGEVLGSSASENGAYYQGNGIFKSTDGGGSWASLPSTASNTPHSFDNIYDFVWRVAVDPSNTTNDEVYAATYGAISRSTDGGATWRSVRINTARYSSNTDVAVTDSGVVYATLSSDGGLGGIWRSPNGTTWTKLTPPNMPATFARIVIGIAPSNPNVVYFLAETPGSGHLGKNFKGDSVWGSLWKYTYVSGDGSGQGGVWEDRTQNLPSFGGSFGDFNPQFSYDMHITVKPDDENMVLVGGTNLYRSTDGFATAANSSWIGGYRNITLDSAVRLQLEYPNHHPDQHAVVFSRVNPNRVYSASDGGVHVTEDVRADSVAWRSLNNGYLTSQFYVVAINHETPGDNLIVGGLQDNGTWVTPTLASPSLWNWIGSGDGSFCAVADGRSSFYVSKQEGKAYRVLLDNQGELDTFARIDPLGGRNYLFINPFVLDPANTDIMYLSGGNQLWRNSDLTGIPLGGTAPTAVNWTNLANAGVSAAQHITAFGVSTANPAHTLYYGTDSGRVYRMPNANSGEPTPVDVTTSALPVRAYVACIAVDPLDGNRAVVVFSNYGVKSLFLTTDGGGTWVSISGNLEANPNGTGAGPSCRWFSFLNRGGGTVYLVGTSVGLYSTTKLNDAATVWSLEGAETIGNCVVDVIDVRPADGYVVVGTHGNGVFETHIGLLGVDDDATATDAGLMLDAPVPNPVHASARITFSAHGARDARLEIFDAVGRNVGELFNGTVDGGERTVTFDAYAYPFAALPSGTYYCRLQAGGASLVRPLRLVR